MKKISDANLMAQFCSKATLVFVFSILCSSAFSQLLLPYTFQNDSRYADAEIYIGLVGIYNDEGVWMDLATSTINPQIGTVQDMPGPEFANSPGGDNLYPDIFTRLSDIPNKKINIPLGLAGCRIFISFESPMYLYFHEEGGYAGANLQNPNDPNDGIRWEIVELTWGEAGLWTNTSRVDAYQYPMGLEVTGYDGAADGATYEERYNNITSAGSPNKYKKIGELLTHQRILDSWENAVGPAFQNCKVVKVHSLDGEPIIEQPSKVPEFKEGGEFENYFDAYINDIWTAYTTKTLSLNIGDRGIWEGTVTGDQFNFVDPADGTIATIYGKPSTSDAIEGAGFLAYTPVSAEENQEKHNEDLMIQAQVSAAINRHAIYTDAADGVTQDNHDSTRFFKRTPFNDYVDYFHCDTISFESQTYAFAYDDVGDHSSTIQCTYPTDVLVVIGGYGEDTSSPRAIGGADITVRDDDENGVESVTLDGSLSADRGLIVSHEWTENGEVIASSAIATLDFTIGTHYLTLTVTDDEGLTDTDELVVTVLAANSTNGVVLTPECKTDFTVEVTTELSNPSITFVPGLEGYGEPTCLLFYDTDPANVPGVGATGVTPNVPMQISAAQGETVYFYYVYSNGVGEDNSAGCMYPPQQILISEANFYQ